MAYVYDLILGRIRWTWSAGAGIDMSGGTISVITPPDGVPYIAGPGIGINGATITNTLAGSGRIDVAGGTVTFNPIADIVNVSGTSVTLQPDTAYKIYATSQAITLNANPPAAGKWAYDGHLEIFTAGTGYVVTGPNVVLANALEPDAVNNCTVRFHDGLAIVAVEDHVAGYIVVSGSTSGDGSLYYGITTSTNDYVAFDASLNGTTIPLSGAVANGEKHIVGNGYTETAITGAVDCGTSKFTVANLSLQNVQVTGGMLTLGDAFIPSGSTVALSSGGLAIEKVTGAGEDSVIDLGQTSILVVENGNVVMSDVSVTNGNTNPAIYGSSGGAFNLNRVNIIGNTNGGIEIYGTRPSRANLVSCTVSGNIGGDITLNWGSATMTATDCTFGNVSINRGASVTLVGSNRVEKVKTQGTSPGNLIFTSGSILDLTGNTNATPIAPGGGITFEKGGATVLYGDVGSVSSMFIDNLKPTEIRSGGVVYTSSGDMPFPNSAGASAVISGGIISGGRILNGNEGVLLIEDATVKNQIVIQNLGGAGTVKLAGTVTLAQTNSTPIMNTQATVEGKTWDGILEIASNATISATITAAPIASAIGTLNVGSNVTINGNAIAPGTYTSATIAADGTITEA